MREYSNTISLSKNSRGCYSIDPCIGCSHGARLNKSGCYDDCYAARIAARYGYNFSNTVFRNFDSLSHLYNTRDRIKRIELPFVRMGTMGDPSEDWEHTIKICELIQNEAQLSFFNDIKEIVIITKHWNNLSIGQLDRIKNMKICINTSVSAMDNKKLLKNSLNQYRLLKKYCRSVLRIVSCDFNINTKVGKRLSIIQDSLLNNDKIIDTVFRPSFTNSYVINNIINTKNIKFMKSNSNASLYDKDAYIGHCDKCPEMCGVNL